MMEECVKNVDVEEQKEPSAKPSISQRAQQRDTTDRGTPYYTISYIIDFIRFVEFSQRDS